MIIVDGPDGSGKTTLIEKLGLVRYPLKSLRAGVGAEGKGGAWGDNDTPVVLQYTRKIDQCYWSNIALDRFHFSERVYGPLLRNSQIMDDPTFMTIQAFSRALHVPIVLCLPPLDVTIDNVTKEGRERPAYQTVEFLTEAYKQFLLLAPFATNVYNYVNDSLPTIAKR